MVPGAHSCLCFHHTSLNLKHWSISAMALKSVSFLFLSISDVLNPPRIDSVNPNGPTVASHVTMSACICFSFVFVAVLTALHWSGGVVQCSEECTWCDLTPQRQWAQCRTSDSLKYPLESSSQDKKFLVCRVNSFFLAVSLWSKMFFVCFNH